MELNNSISNRISTVAILVAIAVGGMLCGSLYKIITLKISPPTALEEASVPLHSTTKDIAKRGKILDSRGRILAASRIGKTLFVDPQLVKNPEELALELNDILDISPAMVEEKIRRKPNSRYVVLEPILSKAQMDAVKSLNYRCIGVHDCLVREYPHGNIGDALIG
ncbi:hypothetical protein H8D99_00525 [bacterium]|nr:hypothetical protein [bacterium]